MCCYLYSCVFNKNEPTVLNYALRFAKIIMRHKFNNRHRSVRFYSCKNAGSFPHAFVWLNLCRSKSELCVFGAQLRLRTFCLHGVYFTAVNHRFSKLYRISVCIKYGCCYALDKNIEEVYRWNTNLWEN